MGTSVERTTNVSELNEIGNSYRMPAEAVDGMKVEAVHEAIKRAADRARKGGGPTLLDIRTYRYKGHSMSDPQKYRTKQEVEEYKSEDPIEKVLKTIVDNKFASQAQINKIQDKVKALVDESVEFAENGPNPAADELYDDVYSSEYPFIIE
jgi:pyruvate dehydrogenase E1 component alpha subunit